MKALTLLSEASAYVPLDLLERMVAGHPYQCPHCGGALEGEPVSVDCSRDRRPSERSGKGEGVGASEERRHISDGGARQ